MALLLDTHVLLWALTEDQRLQPDVRERIADGRTPVYVSAASAWEITIKQALGKLRAPSDLPEQLARARFESLAVRVEHALAVGDLPDLHGDPFDRMLIAQARVERLTLVTHDAEVQRYDVAVLAT